VRQKPKSKKRILAHPIIAANWDKDQTLAQNYKRLGLTARLNKNTGGIERKLGDVHRDEDGDFDNRRDALNITSASRRKERIDLGEAKIERDPETGKILRVIEQSKPKLNPLNDSLNDLDSESEDEQALFSLDNQHGANAAVGSKNAALTETVRLLEADASRPEVKYKRRQPQGEIDFIEALVKKYGDDVGKMARDTKINYMQRSEGDLKQRIKKWRASGGSVE
jgi:nucleolar protein 16